MSIFPARLSIAGPMDESRIRFAIYLQVHHGKCLDGFGSTHLTGEFYRCDDRTLLCEHETEMAHDVNGILRELIEKVQLEYGNISADNTAVYIPTGKGHRFLPSQIENYDLLFK